MSPDDYRGSIDISDMHAWNSPITSCAVATIGCILIHFIWNRQLSGIQNLSFWWMFLLQALSLKQRLPDSKHWLEKMARWWNRRNNDVINSLRITHCLHTKEKCQQKSKMLLRPRLPNSYSANITVLWTFFFFFHHSHFPNRTNRNKMCSIYILVAVRLLVSQSIILVLSEISWQLFDEVRGPNRMKLSSY